MFMFGIRYLSIFTEAIIDMQKHAWLVHSGQLGFHEKTVCIMCN